MFGIDGGPWCSNFFWTGLIIMIICPTVLISAMLRELRRLTKRVHIHPLSRTRAYSEQESNEAMELLLGSFQRGGTKPTAERTSCKVTCRRMCWLAYLAFCTRPPNHSYRDEAEEAADGVNFYMGIRWYSMVQSIYFSPCGLLPACLLNQRLSPVCVFLSNLGGDESCWSEMWRKSGVCATRPMHRGGLVSNLEIVGAAARCEKLLFVYHALIYGAFLGLQVWAYGELFTTSTGSLPPDENTENTTADVSHVIMSALFVGSLCCCPALCASGLLARKLHHLHCALPRVWRIYVKGAHCQLVDIERAVREADAEVNACGTAGAGAAAPPAASQAPARRFRALLAATHYRAKQRAASAQHVQGVRLQLGPGQRGEGHHTTASCARDAATTSTSIACSKDSSTPATGEIGAAGSVPSSSASASGGAATTAASLLAAQASHGLTRFEAPTKEMVMGQPVTSALGVHHVLGLSDAMLHGGLAEGIPAIVREFETHGTHEDKECIDYILHQSSGSNLKVWPNGIL